MKRIIWIIFFISSVKCDTYRCPDAQTTQSNESYPDIIQSFQTRVEINVLDKNYTAVAEEHLDYEGNRGLVVLFKGGVEQRVIFNYNANELYKIQDTVCTVQSLNGSSDANLFGIDTSSGTFQINTAADALRFGTKYGQYFVGRSNIRGKPVKQWQTCFNWTSASSTFKVDYYFSDPSWKTSSGMTSVPVRIEVQGNQTSKGDPNSRPFHHVYDFFNYLVTDGQDPALFETPIDVVCPGRVNSRPLPTLPKHFSFRTTMINMDAVSQLDYWYNYDQKITRIDARENMGIPPFYVQGPVTVIEDFNTGLRYMKDRVRGNCSIYPLQNGSYDDITVKSKGMNSSYVQKMKLPFQIFNLDSNFTFVGSRTLDEGIPCDMWITRRDDLDITGLGIPSNVTIEIFFVDKNVAYSPEQGVQWQLDNNFQVPYRVIMSDEGVGVSATYDYSNFNPNPPDLSVFDLSDCYSDQQKLRIKVQFKGQYVPDTEARVKFDSQVIIAETMGLSPLRFQDIGIEYDSSFVFISGTIFDRPPSFAQFTLLPGQEMERRDDQVWANISDASSCADLCITTPDFTCNSFDFCPADSNTCRMSKSHVEEGNIVLKKSICNHFSRTVNVSKIDTKTIDDAYGDLLVQIFNGGLQIAVVKDDQSMQDLIAVNSEVLYGWTENLPLPSIPDSFSYTNELIIHSQNMVYTTDIFYDHSYKLIRFDYRTPQMVPPYYSPYTMTTIHDYNTGIAYDIDQVLMNCTVSGINPVGPTDFDSKVNEQAKKFDGSYIVQMKSPLEILGMSSDYKYVGDKTVRGILCNVFEAVNDKFIPPHSNTTVRAKFQYFFQSSRWTTVSAPGTDETRNQPVMLNVVTEESDVFLTYNFFNFNDEHVSISKFDIKPCYSENQQHRFMMVFNQPFHPYLELGQYIFKTEAVLALASNTGISPIRYQQLEVDHTFNTVFLTATLLGQPYFLYSFKMLLGTKKVKTSEEVVEDMDNQSQCAAKCVNSFKIYCNSFDFCPSNNKCFLHSDHASTIDQNTCLHFSRIVNSTGPTVAMDHAYDVLKDLVYKKLFKISVPQLAGDPYVYTASDIRDDINQAVSPVDTEGSFLQQFTILKNNVILSKYRVTLPNTAVDDCATYCVTEDRFDCQSFEYCYTTGDCSLSSLHPDQHPELMKNHTFCDMYARQYTKEYQKFDGEVLSTQADKLLPHIQTPEDCAASCSKEKEFTCESFDFCGREQSCRLRKTHVLDAGTTVTTSSTCDHYSRNYIYDFEDKGGRLIKGKQDIIINAASASDCAKVCVDQTGILCNTFEYCGNTSQCRVSSSVSIGYRTEADVCDVYSRTTAAKSNSGTQPLCTTSAPSNSTGSMIGIAFGMLLPGMVLGALGLYIFQKRKRTPDPMNIQFVRNDDES